MPSRETTDSGSWARWPLNCGRTILGVQVGENVADSEMPTPVGGNGGKTALAVALLVLAGGGFAWYSSSGKEQAEEAIPAPPPPPKRAAQFDEGLQLPPPDAGLVEEEEEADEKPARRARAQCNGELTATQIRGVINGPARAQVRSCYERRLKANNMLQGTMNLLLTIAPDGRVSSTSLSGSLRDSKVYSCVRNVARTWKFPPPTGGCVRTSVPFSMSPKP